MGCKILKDAKRNNNCVEVDKPQINSVLLVLENTLDMGFVFLDAVVADLRCAPDHLPVHHTKRRLSLYERSKHRILRKVEHLGRHTPYLECSTDP